jgi:hypothetical protein
MSEVTQQAMALTPPRSAPTTPDEARAVLAWFEEQRPIGVRADTWWSYYCRNPHYTTANGILVAERDEAERIAVRVVPVKLQPKADQEPKPKGTGKVRYINGQRIETKPRPQLPERFAAVPKAITLDAELSRDAKAVATVIASLLNTGNNPTLKVTATDAKVAALIGKGVSQIKARHGRIELEAATLLEVQPAGKAGHNMRFPVALYPSELQAELAKARSIPS